MILIVAAVLALTLALYLYHVNRGMTLVPDEALRFSPHCWTADEVKKAYERNIQSPVDVTKHLSPKQNRRYIIVGGSGLVGNWIVTHLLARGEDPAAIRILDLQQPRQEVLDQGAVFIQINITDKTAVSSAFTQSWPTKAIEQLPLTVYHTAAVIRPAERHKALLHLCTAVNLGGTRNVLEAAKAAGASCFIATSSGSVGLRRASFWIAPWTKAPKRLVLVLSDQASDQPKEHDQFLETMLHLNTKRRIWCVARITRTRISELAVFVPRMASTALAQMAVAAFLGSTCEAVVIPPPIIQNFVNAENVSIAHLLYEQQLVSSSPQKEKKDVDIGGQSFVITDPNPPITFSDVYLLLTTLAKTPMNFTIVSAVPLFLFSYLVEFYAIIQYRYLFWLLPPLPWELAQLQPALFAVSDVHTIADDSRARLKPEQSGLGYSAHITTLDGMCKEVEAWNRNVTKGA